MQTNYDRNSPKKLSEAMRTKFAPFSFLLALLLACPAFSQEPAREAVKIGLILPLSGPLAEYGNAFRNGVTMARADAPELFSNIRFIYEDSKYEAKTAVSAFTKLHHQDRVPLVFVWGNPTSEAVAPLAERAAVPTIASVMNPAVSINKRYVIRAANHAAMFSRLLAEYLVEKGYRNLGVVLAENSYLRGVFEGLRAALPPEVSLTEIDNYQPGDNDFRTTVSKVKSGHFDAVGVFLMSGQIAQFYRQLAAQQIDLPTFGTDFFESSTEVEQSGEAMDGAVYAHFGASSEFRKRYHEQFGNDLQLAYAGNGYDMAMIIADTFQRASSDFDGKEIMALLRAKRERNGVGGKFRYRETPEGGAYFEFPIHIKKIDGNDFKVVKTRERE